ncbi:MAG: RNA 2',3'-cyclic phosphodiesterase [candidate division WOR-3 bacterium]|nr:RNA 2',3'-cyclic phosphodiesterase [candidate division WOR-3 bacterium]
MMRSFIAIEIPKGVRDGISKIIADFKKSDYPVRWVANENLHLTLVFLGEVAEKFLDEVKEQLASVAKLVKPFEANLNGLGAFPSQRSPRVIWIGMDKGKNEVSDLQVKIEQALGTIGFKPEDRKFHPHLTIGRVKGFIKDASKIFENNYTSPDLPVNSIVLFKSTLRPEGPIYEKIQEFYFGAPPPKASGSEGG